MREHQVVGVLARPLAQAGVKRDVPAKNALDARADVADDRTRPHDDAAHHAELFDHAKAGQFKCRRCQRMCHAHGTLIEHDAARRQKLKNWLCLELVDSKEVSPGLDNGHGGD